jgi:hypothetical protein
MNVLYGETDSTANGQPLDRDAAYVLIAMIGRRSSSIPGARGFLEAQNPQPGRLSHRTGLSST